MHFNYLYLYPQRHPPISRDILRKQDKHFDFPGLVESPVILRHLIDADHDQPEKAWIRLAICNEPNGLRRDRSRAYWTSLEHRSLSKRYDALQGNVCRTKRYLQCLTDGLIIVVVWRSIGYVDEDFIDTQISSAPFNVLGIGLLSEPSPENQKLVPFHSKPTRPCQECREELM